MGAETGIEELMSGLEVMSCGAQTGPGDPQLEISALGLASGMGLDLAITCLMGE